MCQEHGNVVLENIGLAKKNAIIIQSHNLYVEQLNSFNI